MSGYTFGKRAISILGVKPKYTRKSHLLLHKLRRSAEQVLWAMSLRIIACVKWWLRYTIPWHRYPRISGRIQALLLAIVPCKPHIFGPWHMYSGLHREATVQSPLYSAMAGTSYAKSYCCKGLCSIANTYADYRQSQAVNLSPFCG